MNQNEIELRSEEVQEILTRIPNFLIRWGATIVFILILFMFFLSWLIKYPDVITAPVTITTQIPPEKLVAKSTGRLVAILVKDKENIKANTPLAVIENTANFNDVFYLKETIEKINIYKENFPFEKFQNSEFGEIESAFSIFQRENTANNLNKSLKPFDIEKGAQNLELIQLNERLQLLYSQKEINIKEQQLQKSELNRYETLYSKGIISTQEIEKQRLAFLRNDKDFKNLLSAISQTKSSINEILRANKTTQINENKEYVNLESSYLQSYYNLKNAIKEWELKYVLRSSTSGIVTFLQIWSQNQSVNTGDNIFTVVPSEEKKYIGKVKALAQNSGKIKIGQDVNVRLLNFPDREYGVIKAKIKNISLTPDKEGNILVDIIFPNGLQTSYKKEIVFQQEMSGNADIITSDLRLLNRILFQFNSYFNR